MNNKKIMFVCQFFYPEKVSSAILPFELATELIKGGYCVKALVGFPKEYVDYTKIPKKENINGINIKRIKYLTLNRVGTLGRIINYLSFSLSIVLHFWEFRKIDYCISYTNPPLLPPIIALLSKVFKFKFIFEIYDLYPDTATKAGVLSENGIINKIFNYLTNYALNNCWKIVVLSHECKNYLLKTRKLSDNKIHIISNWYQSLPITKNKYPKKTLTLLYGGNMGIMQDMKTIEDTIMELKNNDKFEFILAGHGNKKEMLESVINKENVNNCQIYDFLPKKDYDSLMERVDLAILSLEQFGVGLGSPSKLYGYLAKGIPIIAIIDSSTDIAKDIYEYQNGIHVNNGDYLNLVENLNDIYNNQNMLTYMHKQSLKLFNEKYTLNNALDQFKILINEENKNESI